MPNGSLFRQKEHNYVTCKKMVATGNYHIKQINSVSERQTSHIFLSFLNSRFYIDTWSHECAYNTKNRSKIVQKTERDSQKWRGERKGNGIMCSKCLKTRVETALQNSALKAVNAKNLFLKKKRWQKRQSRENSLSITSKSETLCRNRASKCRMKYSNAERMETPAAFRSLHSHPSKGKNNDFLTLKNRRESSAV